LEAHGNWHHRRKPLIIIQKMAAHILHNIPAEAVYREVIEVLDGCYGDYQLAVVYCSHVISESPQDPPAFVMLPQHFIQREAAHVFVGRLQD
jgi:hypothetical protein